MNSRQNSLLDHHISLGDSDGASSGFSVPNISRNLSASVDGNTRNSTVLPPSAVLKDQLKYYMKKHLASPTSSSLTSTPGMGEAEDLN
eukprot:CAMPEP_0197237780 /NCGR_PEP_ID=MMETSP1429-20130617/4526_1 /TAXON_ID=49237 /ORGANISM="Chaetoceros  sp., Strain UNC1202" /LENGTH=87 /DNA_ID=CAMNT_0042696853 /DNA_START=13 /DNA_END=276 /DNA_ORIENTATION=+